MSHFTVLITETDKEHNDIEEQLGPFNEERRMPKHIRYTKAQLIKQGRDSCASAKERYDRYMADPIGYGSDNLNHINWLKTEVPPLIEALKNNDEDAFYKEGTSWYEPEDLDENGNYITVGNDDAKWDWYQIGGRWAGFFIPKAGAGGKKGELTLLADPKQFVEHIHSNAVDVIKIKDIDWDAMDDGERKSRAEKWDEESEKPVNNRWVWENNRDDLLQMSKEQYVNQPVNHCTFAVLHRGRWYERGEMGWWGTVLGEKGEDIWETEFKQLLESLDPDTEVTVVDCHI